jgi:hypothetical protein
LSLRIHADHDIMTLEISRGWETAITCLDERNTLVEYS